MNTMQHALPRSVLPSVCISLSTQCSTHHLSQYYPLCVYPYQHSAARVTQISTTDCVYISPYEHSTHALPKSVLPIMFIFLLVHYSTHYPGQYYPLCVFLCQHNAARTTQVSITHCVYCQHNRAAHVTQISATDCVYILMNTVQHALPKSVLPIVCISCIVKVQHVLPKCYSVRVPLHCHGAARITEVSTTDYVHFLSVTMQTIIINQVSITHCVHFLFDRVHHVLPKSVLQIACISLSSRG